jgi:tetratricopeptide (TPR) repeat protein
MKIEDVFEMMQHRFRQSGWVMVFVAAVVLTTGESVAVEAPSALPAGLEAYLEARVLEANGSYREAMDAYEQALQQAPDVEEIRVAFAAFLVDVGMAERAAQLLDGIQDLEPDGMRVKALALAQLSARQTDLADDALEALRAAVKDAPDDPNLLLSLAQTLANQGEVAEAEQIIAGLREDRPSNPRLIEMHADLLRANGRTDEAIALYKECAESGPAVQTCRDDLVSLLVESDRPGEAGELMLQWHGDLDLDALMQAAALLWEGNRLQLSLTTVQRVLAKAPDSPRALVLEAHLLSALGRHEEAIDRLQKLLKKSPDDIDLILALAWSLGRTGEMEKAERWLDRGWEQVQSDAGSKNAVRCALTAARLEILADKPMVARSWLDRVGNYEFAGVDYVRLLAETYRANEQWQEGITALVRVQPHLEGRAQIEAEAMEAEFRLRLDDPRAWRRLRPLLDSAQLPDVMIALQVLQSVELWDEVASNSAAALDRFGENRELLFIRASALERLGENEAAEEVFRGLVEADPDDANAANYLGYMWADRSVNLDEAMDLISRAVALDPDNAAYLDSLGWVNYRRGNLDEAVRWLRRAADVAGNIGDGTIYCHLGEVLLASDQTAEGRRYLQLGLDMGCDDPEHVRSLLDRKQDAQP